MTTIESAASSSRSVLLAWLIGLFLLTMTGRARAQTTFGSLSNFDVFNDTGQPCHGFEIELDGITSANVTYKFGGTYQQYGDPVVVDFPGGVYVRYISAYDPVKGWAATTPMASTPITPTMGHACWTGGIPPAGLPAYPNGGCEHFGLGLSANPTNTVYRWLVADPANPGSLIASGTKVSIPAPTWSVAQPVPAQPVVVAVAIPAPPQPPVPVCEFGDAQWVKVYVTQSQNPQDLNHLVTDDPGVPNDPAEIETEWSLQQVDSGIQGGGVHAELSDSSPLGAGDESVTRRMEFYKYTGPIDPETCEALPSSDSNPLPSEVGDYIGAQIGAANIVIPATTISVPLALAFGAMPVGNAVSKSLTIKNTGKKNALIIQNTASSTPEFTVGASTCPPGGIAPGGSCTISLTFTPSGLGARTSTLTLTDNAGTGTQPVALSGTGLVTTSVAPAGYSIGNVRFGMTAVRTVYVTNRQNQSVALSTGFTGPNAGDFSITGGTCGPSIPAKTLCTLIVTFTPGALGSEAATLIVTPSPDPLAPYSVGFTVAGTVAPTVKPVVLAYGKVVQSVTKTLNVTVTNQSGYALNLNQSISGANAADFGVAASGSCAANTVCQVPVTFTPSSEAAESATLSVSIDQDPTSPHLISLSGTGATPIKLVPVTTLAFGNVARGKSKTLSVAVTNLGTALLTLAAPGISGTNAADFSPATAAINPCGAALAGGASCNVGVTFSPSIAGPESATLAVSASPDAASPHNLGLTGTGL